VSARSALLRQLLTGRRTLLVLDNAAGEEQVRPLLPGSPGCLTLVTTRRSLPRLPATLRVVLDVFTSEEAVAFLERAAARVPSGRDPQALQRIAHRCGYLPLALSLLAARMRSASGWTLTEHADRLDERHRIRRLDSGVEIALGLSYQHLPAARRRLLRLLAMHPGPDFDAYAAAALAKSDLDSATEGLRQLCHENLLREGSSGRYAVHDLVRAHAAERAGDEDPPSQRRSALSGLFDHYLSASAAAMDVLYPADIDRRPRVPAPPTPIPPVPNVVAARAWLDTERTNLVATAISATSTGSHHHSIQLAATLLRYLISGYFTDAITIFDQARIAAQREDDATQEAEALFGLGTVQGRLGRHSAATDYLRSALERFRRAGNRQGQARTLGNLGAVAQRRTDYGGAAAYHQQALALFDEVGDRLGAARALNNLGDIEARHGNYEQAAAHHGRALDLHRQIGDPTGEAAALTNLGTVEVLRGRPAAAAEHHRRALELYLLAGHQSGQAWALDGIASAHTGLGQPEAATGYHRQALELFQQIGEREGEARALNGLGEAAHLAGDPEAAVSHHRAALAIAEQIEAFDQEARAHHALGRVHHAAGRRDEAHQHWRRALARYTELGYPEADAVRAALG
jgi:tetratricopeptide (TPR) repeat protein